MAEQSVARRMTGDQPRDLTFPAKSGSFWDDATENGQRTVFPVRPGFRAGIAQKMMCDGEQVRIQRRIIFSYTPLLRRRVKNEADRTLKTSQ